MSFYDDRQTDNQSQTGNLQSTILIKAHLAVYN